MRVDWTYDGCDPEDERTIESLWEGYQAELEAKLGELPVEPAELRLAVLHDSDSDQWEVQAALHLPAQTLTAEVTGAALEDVLDRVVAALVQEIDEQADVPTEIERRRQGLEAILPLLIRYRSENRSSSFFSFLGPLMGSLRTHAQRELDILQIEGVVNEEEIEPDDVLDEAMLRAWDRFNNRPDNVPLDLWLIGLIHEVIDDYARGTPHESLEEERQIALPEEDEQSSPYTWIEQATYPETVELGELLPGHPGLEAWDRLDMETRQTRLSRLLSVLTQQQRHTLILNAVEGFEPEVIAAFQGRTPEEVKADIEAARRKLADMLSTEH